MARTLSRMIELASPAPNFSLPTPAGNQVSLTQFTGRPLLVVFLSNHCPFVQHIRPSLIELGSSFREEEIGIVGINSNDFFAYPADAPEKMEAEGYPFPYLVDETQSVARYFGAACTPDFFLFDRGHSLAYRGQFDGSRPGNGVTPGGEDIRLAIEAVLAGSSPPTEQRPSLGCNIKWKKGNEP